MRKAWRVTAIWLIILTVTITNVIGCSSSSGTTAASPTPEKKLGATPAVATGTTPTVATGTTPTTSAAAPQFSGTVNIGVMGPMSGATALIGLDMVDGTQMAAEQVNAVGGIKVGGKAYKVNVVPYDDQYKPEVAVNLGRRLRAVDNAVMLVGPMMSSSTLAIMEINEKEDFLIITMSVAGDITKKGNKLLIRANGTVEFRADDAAKLIAGKEGYKNWGIVADGGDMGAAFAKTLANSLPAAGGKAIITEWVDQGKQTDFYTQLTKVISQKPDILAINCHDACSSMIIKQSRELGWTGPFYMLGLEEEGRRLAGWDKIGVGSYLSASPGDLERPATLKYIKDFKAKYNKGFLSYGMYSYANFMLGIRAMEKAGTVTDVAKIRAAVPDVYEAVNKEVPLQFLNYTPNGQVELMFPVLKHTGNGKLELVK